MEPFKRTMNTGSFQAGHLVAVSDISPRAQLPALVTMVKKFAPVVCYQPGEQFMPVCIDWYLQNAWLVNGANKTRVPAANSGLHSTPGAGARYYIEPWEENAELKKEPPVKTYVHAKTNGNFTDLQYWFFQRHTRSVSANIKWLIDGSIKGYEGKINLDPLGNFGGSWERITVRVNNVTGSAEQVFFPRSGKGAWIPIHEVHRRGTQVLVYCSKNNCSFYPEPGSFETGKVAFNLYSSQLEFSIQHESGKGRELDFSDRFELISADCLTEDRPEEPQWLNFASSWGNPNLEYLNVSAVKLIVMRMFGKPLEFLLTRDIFDELVNYLLVYFTDECRNKGLAPKLKKCWSGAECD